MSKQSSPSPVLTPQLTPSVAGYVNTKLWYERPAKYSKHVRKNVCMVLFVLSVFSQVTNFTIAQSLKNLFQKLGWSNKGSTLMKLTYDSLSQFMCIIAGYISDERRGKFKTAVGCHTGLLWSPSHRLRRFACCTEPHRCQ
jgi:peptide/histidine transporter 3/4